MVDQLSSRVEPSCRVPRYAAAGFGAHPPKGTPWRWWRMPTPSVEPPEERPPGQLDSETLEHVASFTERMRLALDDLFDALYPDNGAEVHLDLIRVRADSLDTQFRKFEHSIARAQKLPRGEERSA